MTSDSLDAAIKAACRLIADGVIVWKLKGTHGFTMERSDIEMERLRRLGGRTPEGAVQLADEALYEAKRAGRNRVAVKDEDAYRRLDTGAFNAARKARAS